jgi:uncharacterized phage protein (TIGR02218 family)
MSDGLTSWAICWRIARRDGVAIGLTGHDRDLVIDGLAYRAAPGMVPSAIERSDGIDAEMMEVAGALTAAAITERDLVAGRWDGAEIRVFATDWTAPGEMLAVLGTGSIGAVSVKDGGFTAELRGPGAALDTAVNETTSPDCRAELGDKRCRVAMAGRRFVARVVSIDEAELTISVAGGFGGGRLRWLTGLNSGLESAVLIAAGAVLTLREPPAFVAVAGDRLEVSEGCDKTLATCRSRFANAANFRGEPFLPGIDLLTRYPGA